MKVEAVDIIERVEGPTLWVSPMVATRKPKQSGEIQLGIDMRLPNLAIKCERHLTPTVDDIICEITGSRWFSKMDLRLRYHQIMLAPESRHVTTFSTHLGIRRYKCLNIGILSAAEVFQDLIWEVLVGLEGVLNISDDILVHALTLEEHLVQLKTVFLRLQDSGLTLHLEKCEFLKSEIRFLG